MDNYDFYVYQWKRNVLLDSQLFYLRRNKEASNAKKSRGAQNSHVEEAANAEPTVTIQENAVLLTEPPEESH
ncbi:hypothetical protein OUZ56_010271 [Daphnia magna]|uniref:Uncharacterized protein n=1 Tax=Daphnia magna TaxID=35525 RepID=A0ABR0AI27_9CRUS|nr:hypothetical protein OUZ56_010271 [Daphnia magna]